MSLENLLDHTCNIYHIKKEDKSPGYGLAASPSFEYPKEPDISGQPCHFGIRSRSTTIVQTAPAKLLNEKDKLTLPAGTDVRLNDKIVDCDTGLEYTAEVPRNIRGHHLIVYLKTEEGQRVL